MIIVWGTKVRRKWQGRMADFCPICRDVRPRRVDVVYAQDHFCLIPASRRRYLAFEAKCESCGVKRHLDWTPDATFSKDRRAAVAELLKDADAVELAKLDARADMEQRLALGELLPEERHDLISEVLIAFEWQIAPRTQTIHLDRLSGSLMAIGLVGMIALIVAFDGANTAAQRTTPALVFAGVCFVLVLLSLATDTRRHFRRRVLPLLARGLKPLQPSLDELEKVVANLKRHQLTIARYAKPAVLMAALEKQLQLSDFRTQPQNQDF